MRRNVKGRVQYSGVIESAAAVNMNDEKSVNFTKHKVSIKCNFEKPVFSS